MADLQITQIEHSDVRKRVLDLRKKVEESYWELSQSLSEVYGKSYYIAWGFQSWKEYVESELEFALRKAQYLVSISDWFSKMSPQLQDWIKGLGWTKAKELVGVVNDENAADWQARLEGLTYAQLVDELKGKGKDIDTPLDGEGDKDVAEDKPQKKAFSLFPEQSANVAAALDKAKQLANTEKDGHALDLICSDFLATNAGTDDMFSVIKRIEKSSGLYFIAYNKQTDSVVYGAEILDEIAGSSDSE